MITCCLKSLPSVVESPTETLVVQIEFRKEDKKDNIMATSVHPDKFRGESLELEREPQELSEEDKLKLFVAENLSSDATFKGPFGRKPVLNCDWLSSGGRSLKFVEDFFHTEVLPILSSWSSISTMTALQTTLFCDEAKNMARKACNANSDDKIVFTTNPNKIIKGLLSLESSIIVFMGINQDNVSYRLWAQGGAELVIIPENTHNGHLDLNYLEQQLEMHWKKSPQKVLIGFFSVASKLTGVFQDDLAITSLLHDYGALAIWDYTTAAPYATIDMNPYIKGDIDHLYRKDGLVFSGTKFTGGGHLGCSIMVLKTTLHQALFRNELPGEEPKIPESVLIRMGMIIQLKEVITSTYLLKQQRQLSLIVARRLESLENLICLGPKPANLSVLAFVVKHPLSGLYLHHKFVSTLLNDLFGLQTSVSSAHDSPFVKYSLGIQHIDGRDDHKNNGSKEDDVFVPGVSVLDLPWFFTEEQVKYVLDALELISNEGWKLLPQYILSLDTGEWSHFTNSAFTDCRSLHSIDYKGGNFKFQAESRCGTHQTFSLPDNLLKAKETLRSALKLAQSCQIIDLTKLMSEGDMERRWFLLSHEAQLILIKQGRKMSKGQVTTQVLCEDRLAIRSYGGERRRKSNFDEDRNSEEWLAKRGEQEAAVGSLSGKVDGAYVCKPRKNPSLGKSHWLKNSFLPFSTATGKDVSKASENPSTGNEDPLQNGTPSKDFDNALQSSKEISDVMDSEEEASDAIEEKANPEMNEQIEQTENSDSIEIKEEMEKESTPKSSNNSWFPFSSIWRRNKKPLVEEEHSEPSSMLEDDQSQVTTIDLTVKNGKENETTLASIKEEQEDEQR